MRWDAGRDRGGRSWHGKWRIGRLHVGYDVYLHKYVTTSDRWVIRPWIIFDRKG